MEKVKLLVVDDEDIVRVSLCEWLTQAGYAVFAADDAFEALNVIDREKIFIAIADIRMPGIDGIELMRRAKKINPHIAFILITAHASVESAVSSMREGAYDYIEKPFCPEKIELQIRKLTELQSLLLENINLKKELGKKYSFADILGKSHKMQLIFDEIATVANSTASILIEGETGTGKELVARAIHNASNRKDGPFVAVSCAALPESLLETELFGHEKGAFTGAATSRKGKFEFADKGSIFLDEIGEISPNIQMHLLRVLQEKNFCRVGSNEDTKVDVRLISATNKNLAKLVEEEKFREDLFYRLNVVTITLPPLRERREDIPLLAEHFLRKFNGENGKNIGGFSMDAMEFFMKYEWRGNIRELQNFVEHAVIICKDGAITKHDLPVPETKAACAPSAGRSLDEVDKNQIESVMKETSHNLTRAAEILGISRVTLYNKIKKYGIT